MMGSQLQNGPLSFTIRGAVLRRERERTDGVTLAQVAARFRKGVTRERIRQIESCDAVSEVMAADFRRALKLARGEREAVQKAAAKARRDCANRKINGRQKA